MPYRLLPAVLLGALARTGCEDGTPESAETTASATGSPAMASPSVTASSEVVMPDLHHQTYEKAHDELEDFSDVRIKATARHKDVTLPHDHHAWRVCVTSPRPDTRIPAGDTVVLKLAKQTSDCAISHHGYLHKKNDPAYTPPHTPSPEPPKPKPAPTRTPGDAMTTCPDGKRGYACTSTGHPVVDGQFCPKADHGRTVKATNGTMVTCSYDPSVNPYRWQ